MGGEDDWAEEGKEYQKPEGVKCDRLYAYSISRQQSYYTPILMFKGGCGMFSLPERSRVSGVILPR